jgi:hypothetical protein
VAHVVELIMKLAVSQTRYGSDPSDRKHDHNQRIMRDGECGKPNFYGLRGCLTVGSKLLANG